MSGRSELKRLAEAIESCTSIPQEDEAAWMRRTTGKAVVELLDELDERKAENKSLLAELKVASNVGRCHGMALGSVVESRDALVRALDQSSAENEALRKDAERLNWLDKRSMPVVEGERWSQPEGELWGYEWTVAGQCSTVREAIDYAMCEEVKHD